MTPMTIETMINDDGGNMNDRNNDVNLMRKDEGNTGYHENENDQRSNVNHSNIVAGKNDDEGNFEEQGVAQNLKQQHAEYRATGLMITMVWIQ